jgi:hypothetical protein
MYKLNIQSVLPQARRRTAISEVASPSVLKYQLQCKKRKLLTKQCLVRDASNAPHPSHSLFSPQRCKDQVAIIQVQ